MVLLLAEIVFVGLVVAGVAVMYWPAALILAGVAGVFACERASARRAEDETHAEAAGR